MGTALPNINYTSRDFTSIEKELSDWIRAQKPELWNDFYESNLGEFLIQLIAYHGDLISFLIDRVGEEAMWPTMRLYRTALKHSKMIGYQPHSATAASVDMVAESLPATINVYPVSLPAGTRINIAQMNWEVDKDYVFPAGSTEIRFGMKEGVTLEMQYVSTGEQWQRFRSEHDLLIDGSWVLTVDGVEWTHVEFVEMETSTSPTYSVEWEGDRSLIFRFGDGITGQVPPANALIEVTYRQGGGTRGNIPARVIATTITAYLDNSPVQLNVINPEAASGGTDREDLEHIRRWGPLNVRTVDKCITREDYTTEAASFSDPAVGAISRATSSLREGTLLLLQTALSEELLEIPAGTNVTIGDIVFKTLTKMKLNGGNPNLAVDPNTVDVWTWAETVDGDSRRTHTTPASPLREAVLAHLDDRSVVTVTPVVRDGKLVPIDIDLGVVTIDRRYSLTDVATAIESATEEFFMQDAIEPGTAFRISDYYNVIENVAGVDHFEIQSPIGDIEVEYNELIIRGTLTKNLEHKARNVPETIVGRY